MNQGLIDYLSDCQRNKKIEAIDSYNSNYYNGIIFKAANSIYKVIDVTHAGPSALQKHAFIKNLTKKQRIVGFMTCFILGIFCFIMASLCIPVLVFKARKFAVLYSIGSVLFLGSFSFLWGPYEHMRLVLSTAHLPFSAFYCLSVLATLYFALLVHSALLAVISAALQITALLCFAMSYLPGGKIALTFLTRYFCSSISSSVTETLSV